MGTRFRASEKCYSIYKNLTEVVIFDRVAYNTFIRKDKNSLRKKFFISRLYSRLNQELATPQVVFNYSKLLICCYENCNSPIFLLE